MAIPSAALVLAARPRAATSTAAVVAPLPGCPYAGAFVRRGVRTIAVTLASRLRPLDLPADAASPYAGTVEHRGSLRPTVKALRAAGVTAVLPGSAAGIELAERISWHLGLPAGDPEASALRYDRGAQAMALERAGVPSARTIRSGSLAEALRWADTERLDGYTLAPAAAGTPVPAVTCATDFEIRAAWPALRRATARYSGSAHLVLTEQLSPREYVINSVSRPGPDGIPEHCITDVWAESRGRDGMLDRTDLLDRHQLLSRALSRYLLRALDVLGVVCGPVTSRVAYSEGRGPLLISSLAAPPPASLADDALRAATGEDRVARALEAWLPAPRTELSPVPAPPRRVVRVHLQARAGDSIDPWLGRIVRQLPTVVAVSDALRASTSCPSTTGQPEIVLSSTEPEAVEADYRVIRALEREGLYRVPRP
ncbi:hypothetical protein [Streptomyces lancefieldiae]|uniref:ATP-grasp domain-containing protein n=1 Tax=Streptomyces lancefieldiae TaxID=3075520 RepID=A0ABU3B1Z3_9ACTN|nr:hypothetical protein [Streptomyces sp. DSM 40712]MDT0616289.1 hypothetical protein [Streptomyces sp. DSM 40712]